MEVSEPTNKQQNDSSIQQDQLGRYLEQIQKHSLKRYKFLPHNSSAKSSSQSKMLQLIEKTEYPNVYFQDHKTKLNLDLKGLTVSQEASDQKKLKIKLQPRNSVNHSNRVKEEIIAKSYSPLRRNPMNSSLYQTVAINIKEQQNELYRKIIESISKNDFLVEETVKDKQDQLINQRHEEKVKSTRNKALSSRCRKHGKPQGYNRQNVGSSIMITTVKREHEQKHELMKKQRAEGKDKVEELEESEQKKSILQRARLRRNDGRKEAKLNVVSDFKSGILVHRQNQKDSMHPENPCLESLRIQSADTMPPENQRASVQVRQPVASPKIRLVQFDEGSCINQVQQPKYKLHSPLKTRRVDSSNSLISKLKSAERSSIEDSSDHESTNSNALKDGLISKQLSLPPIASNSKIIHNQEGLYLEELTRSHDNLSGAGILGSRKTIENPVKPINRNDYFGKRSKSYKRKETTPLDIQEHVQQTAGFSINERNDLTQRKEIKKRPMQEFLESPVRLRDELIKKRLEIKHKYQSNMDIGDGQQAKVLRSVIADKQGVEVKVRIQADKGYNLGNFVANRRLNPSQVVNSKAPNRRRNVQQIELDDNQTRQRRFRSLMVKYIGLKIY